MSTMKKYLTSLTQLCETEFARVTEAIDKRFQNNRISLFINLSFLVYSVFNIDYVHIFRFIIFYIFAEMTLTGIRDGLIQDISVLSQTIDLANLQTGPSFVASCFTTVQASVDTSSTTVHASSPLDKLLAVKSIHNQLEVRQTSFIFSLLKVVLFLFYFVRLSKNLIKTKPIVRLWLHCI